MNRTDKHVISHSAAFNEAIRSAEKRLQKFAQSLSAEPRKKRAGAWTPKKARNVKGESK